MVLHEGQIAEMQTGEGKTLVATLPAYLNAVSGRGVHMITVNDYLARRDAEWCASVLSRRPPMAQSPCHCSLPRRVPAHDVHLVVTRWRLSAARA